MEKVKTENRWLQRLWIDHKTLRVLHQNGMQSSAIPGLEKGDCLCCDINFSAPYSVRLPVEPTGYLVRFGEHLRYFASLDAEREHNFRLYNKRVVYSMSIPEEANAARQREQKDHLHNLARKHPTYFRERLRPVLEEKGIDAAPFVATAEAALDQWAREFPAQFVGEPAAYEVLIHADDAGVVSALLAEIFEDIQPVKLLDGYQLSCIKPMRGRSMVEAIEVAKETIKKFL